MRRPPGVERGCFAPSGRSWAGAAVFGTGPFGPCRENGAPCDNTRIHTHKHSTDYV